MLFCLQEEDRKRVFQRGREKRFLCVLSGVHCRLPVQSGVLVSGGAEEGPFWGKQRGNLCDNLSFSFLKRREKPAVIDLAHTHMTLPGQRQESVEGSAGAAAFLNSLRRERVYLKKSLPFATASFRVFVPSNQYLRLSSTGFVPFLYRASQPTSK